MSAGPGFGSTLTSGVQQISAFLPLLGTEECENHVASALTQGYLYAAASPISLFGSLGVARSGFKTLMCGISIPQLKIDGAKLLANTGFKPKGMNLSLIMLDEEGKSYSAENRIDSMIKELHIEDSNRITVVSKNSWWNVQMIVSTALSCIISVTPYIHLNLQEPNSLNRFIRWAFPVMRAIGSFLTVMTMQLVIQMRLLAIVRKWLVLKGLQDEELESLGIKFTDEKSFWVCHPALDQRCWLVEQHIRCVLGHPPNPTARLAQLLSLFGVFVRQILGQHSPRNSTNTVPSLGDVENAEANPQGYPNHNQPNKELQNKKWKGLQEQITKANGSSLAMWTLLVFLLVGVALSVVGYVGCFSAVQGSGLHREPLIWLGLEVVLSIIRMIIWGLNPKCDDAPPLEFKFQLDENSPLPTCTHTAEEIVTEKTLPVVRADEFLQLITSYAGLLKQFSHPLLTLYYTLTWKRHVDKNDTNERILYITIFDHAERTTRVYTESDLRLGPNGNLENGSIIAGSPDMDMATSNVNVTKPWYFSAGPITIDLERDVLEVRLGPRIEHNNDPIAMNSTLQTELAKHYYSILGQVNNRIITNGLVHDTFTNDWHLRFRGTSEIQHRSKNDHIGAIREQVYRSRDHAFLEKGRLERILKRLFCGRGKWIEEYTQWSSDDMDSKVCVMKALSPTEEHGVDSIEDDTQRLLKEEHITMELLHVYEVHQWEMKLWEEFQDVINLNDLCSGKTVIRRWRAGLVERLETERQAMLARTSAWSKCNFDHFLKDIENSWQSLFKDLTSAVPIPAQWYKYHRLGRYDFYQRRLCGSWCAWIEAREEEAQRRLDSELEEIEDRLRQGFEHCAQFATSRIHHRHSDLKWQNLDAWDHVTIAALKRNPHIWLITLNIDTILELTPIYEALPQCTSFFFYSNFFNMLRQIPLSPNILSISGNAVTQSAHNVCAQNQLTETTRTTFVFANMHSQPSSSSLFACSSARFTIRFLGPSSHLLTLQLSHMAQKSGQMLHIEMNGSPSDHPVLQIQTFEEIKIYNASAPYLPRSALVFIPEHHNILTFFPPEHYQLFTLELVDQSWRPYQPGKSGKISEESEESEEIDSDDS